MEVHGGSLETAFRPRSQGLEQKPSVDEVHVLKFPDLDACERYKNDDRLRSLGALREQAISDTRVYVSDQEADYTDGQ